MKRSATSGNQARIDRTGRCLARVLKLVRILQTTRHGYTLQELAERQGVCLNQLELDLRIIEAAGAMVYRDRAGDPGGLGHQVVVFGVRFEESRELERVS